MMVGGHGRRQDAVADRKPDQPLPDQLSDAVGLEEECRRLADAVHPEQIAGHRQGSQLAAGTGRSDLSGDAAVLAEDRSAVGPARGQWDLEATRDRGGAVALTKGARDPP